MARVCRRLRELRGEPEGPSMTWTTLQVPQQAGGSNDCGLGTLSCAQMLAREWSERQSVPRRLDFDMSRDTGIARRRRLHDKIVADWRARAVAKRMQDQFDLTKDEDDDPDDCLVVD